jgi:predicted DNA-binding transcriptional regulator AlpA
MTAEPVGPLIAAPDCADSAQAADPVEELRDVSQKSRAKVLPPMLLSADDLAKLLRVSKATIWRLRAAGKLLKPIESLGPQLLRWRYDETWRWIKAGMPNAATWTEMEKAR